MGNGNRRPDTSAMQSIENDSSGDRFRSAFYHDETEQRCTKTDEGGRARGPHHLKRGYRHEPMCDA